MVDLEGDEDRRIGRRAALGLLATVGAGLIVGPLLTAVNLILALASNRTPNVEPAPGVRTITRWRDNLPLDVPWWAFLAVSLALVVLLIVVWKPERHYRDFWRQKVILIATPVAVGASAFGWAVMTVAFGLFYTGRDDWQGYIYLPTTVALAVAAVAFERNRRANKLATKRQGRRKPRGGK